MKQNAKKQTATWTPLGFAAYSGFGQTATYRLLAEGKIPAIRVGARFYIPKAAAERWLESCGQSHERTA